MLTDINSCLNNLVWGPFMLLLMVGVGIFFSCKLRFFQLRCFRTWWHFTAGSFLHKDTDNKTDKNISPFQAMATALAGSIGTGNIVGVANAIALGGAGAVFWMWVSAFFGMATVFAENVLGVKYRIRKNGRYMGGPMYYIEKGLGCKWLAVLFAVFCTGAAFGMGNMTQSNSAAGALHNGFGIPCEISGAVIALLTGLIVFGGIGRIAGLTEKLIPVMSVIFMLAMLVVLFSGIDRLPDVFGRILSEALDYKAVSGGTAGYGIARAVKYGISRGVFSNEAGLGSSPIIYSSAETDNPYKQGMWGIFQVFVDTIVMCTLTALCILSSDANITALDGIELGSYPFTAVFGDFGRVIISVSIVLFAFATLISWSYYGEKSFEYLSGGRGISIYRILYVTAAFTGAVCSLSAVWEISDTLNGLMALPNLAALVLLSKEISYHELKHSLSLRGRASGKQP